ICLDFVSIFCACIIAAANSTMAPAAAFANIFFMFCLFKKLNFCLNLLYKLKKHSIIAANYFLSFEVLQELFQGIEVGNLYFTCFGTVKTTYHTGRFKLIHNPAGPVVTQ